MPPHRSVGSDNKGSPNYNWALELDSSYFSLVVSEDVFERPCYKQLQWKQLGPTQVQDSGFVGSQLSSLNLSFPVREMGQISGSP